MILFTDLDGTLLDDHKDLTFENREAISQALSAGHKIVITTGRPLASGLLRTAVMSSHLTAVRSMICTTKKVFLRKTSPQPTWHGYFRRQKEEAFTARHTAIPRFWQSGTIPVFSITAPAPISRLLWCRILPKPWPLTR